MFEVFSLGVVFLYTILCIVLLIKNSNLTRDNSILKVRNKFLEDKLNQKVDIKV